MTDDQLRQWHDFYTVWPRYVGGKWRWLETIERIGECYRDWDGGGVWYWFYREKA